MIEQDLVAYVASLATAAGVRVHHGNAPQNSAFPYVVILRTGGTTPKTLGGTSLFTRGNFSISVYAKEYADAYPVANAIKAALHGFTGAMGSTAVQSTRCTNETSDISATDGDLVIRWLAQDYLLVYSE